MRPYIPFTTALLLFYLPLSIAAENPDDTRLEQQRLLSAGAEQLSQRAPGKAINDYFNGVLEYCDKEQEKTDQQIYAARSSDEALFYLLGAAAESKAARVDDPLCADAHYLKGYALIEIGNIDFAQEQIEMALAMSPANARYLSELAHIHQYHHQWSKAMDIFEKAEGYAETFTPEDLRSTELSRAKRGVGFSLIELGRLDEAEKKFRECLEINKDDKSAIRELKYIEKLRASNATPGSN